MGLEHVYLTLDIGQYGSDTFHNMHSIDQTVVKRIEDIMEEFISRLLGERSEPLLVNSMPILFVCMFVCLYVYMSSTDRGQCACVPAQRANVAGLASSGRCARPQMLCILLV